MTELIDNICNVYPYKVLKKDIEWTKKFIIKVKNGINGKDNFIWTTSSASYYLNFKTKKCEIVEIDSMIGFPDDVHLAFKEISRSLHVLKKMGYSIFTSDKMIVNGKIDKRLLPDGSEVDRSIVHQSTYSDTTPKFKNS